MVRSVIVLPGWEDGWKGCTVDGAVLLHGIFAYVAGVGHLLGKDNDVQAHRYVGLLI